MSTPTLTRRSIIKSAALLLAWPLCADESARTEKITFGLCADPHKDVMHDTDQRLQEFISAMQKLRPDFILQMGDFCRPSERNRSFMNIWEQFAGPRYHMLGNHDRDGGFAWDAVMKFWGMKERFYSFDQRGWHFVVLDGNEKNPLKPAPGYPRFIGKEQLAWLTEDLKKTSVPTVIFSHQSLEDPEGIENNAAVRAVLEAANAVAGWKKIGVCFSGHHHIDFQREINGIHYVQINSMSYSWLGDRYKHIRYSPEIDKAFPSIKSTAPYKDALYATVTLSPEGHIQITGRESEFVGPSPWELGVPEVKGTARDKDRLVPKISNRKVTVAVK